MRDIQKVIKHIINQIPEGRLVHRYDKFTDSPKKQREWEPLAEELRKIYERVSFLAPEVRSAAWTDVARVLYDCLGKSPFPEPWMQTICDIFNGTIPTPEEEVPVLKKYDYVVVLDGLAARKIGRLMRLDHTSAAIRLGLERGDRFYAYKFRLLRSLDLEKDLAPRTTLSYGGPDTVEKFHVLEKAVMEKYKLTGMFEAFPAPVSLEGWRLPPGKSKSFEEGMPAAVKEKAKADKKREEERQVFEV